MQLYQNHAQDSITVLPHGNADFLMWKPQIMFMSTDKRGWSSDSIIIFVKTGHK